MGKAVFLTISLLIISNLSFSLVGNNEGSWLSQNLDVYDSVQLKKDSVYICEGHFFEWCKEPSTCAHCNEQLSAISLWDYYKKLECEDCKRFFEENYNRLKTNNTTL
jgi:hypothetical protein